MSEFFVKVVRVGAIEKHPNADSLSTTSVDGYPVILRTGEFVPGDLAVYVPVDAIVPADDERWVFLKDLRRIKSKRLRGIFSMGLLTAADPSWSEGDDVRDAMRIDKYDPAEAAERGSAKLPGGHDDAAPTAAPPIYDIEGLRKHRTLFDPGEDVWISEKIHGQNARFMHDGERLHAGSRTRWKKPGSPTTWTAVAERYDLAAKLAAHPGLVLYGETYGNNTDMPYGVRRAQGDRLVLFDVLDARSRQWFGVEEFLAFAERLGLPVVPTLYRGPWSPDLAELAEGRTTMPGADHVREGIVVKPMRERVAHIGRVFLKLPGEGYLTRKGG